MYSQILMCIALKGKKIFTTCYKTQLFAPYVDRTVALVRVDFGTSQTELI